MSFVSSIPFEIKDNKHSNCLMFNADYSQLQNISHVEIVACKDGWNFDRSMYKETIVTEVN